MMRCTNARRAGRWSATIGGSLALVAVVAAAAGAQRPERHSVGVSAGVTTLRAEYRAPAAAPAGRGARPWDHAFVGALIGVPVVTAGIVAADCTGTSVPSGCGLAGALLGPPLGLVFGGAVGYAHGVASERGCDVVRTTLVSTGMLLLASGAMIGVTQAAYHVPDTDGNTRRLLGGASAIATPVLGVWSAVRVARRCRPRTAG
ncbi:MAG TPA: hypothetical protein VFJ74_07735 [Gemmatimonadaceae bacterium]|nr:hypothetical protein [Gemmatimonadaceae bacterium]